MKKNIVPIILLTIVAVAAYFIVLSVQEGTKQAQNAIAPISNVSSAMQTQNASMQTQVSDLLHPTPTIIPDPVTIIHDIRALARLETIQYSVEKVITAEIGQGNFGFLFGDKMLFVAHGVVIAGIDMEKLGPENMKLEGDTLYVGLVSPGTGWAAVGFSLTHGMKGADIIIGAVTEEGLVIEDHYGSSPTSHRQDESSRITRAEGKEVEGKTTIEFAIPLASPDPNDVALTPGSEITVILAYQASSDSLTARHTKRSALTITLD